MDENKTPPRKVKVVDRRKFTTAGDPRDRGVDAPEPVPARQPVEEPPPEMKQPGRTDVRNDEPGPANAETSVKFLELVAMLAHQAEILMVGAEDLPAQPAEAQRVIDYLGALEEKTAGNLSPEEGQILENLVFQLRTLFIQNTNK